MGTMDGIRVVEVASWTYVPIAGAVLAEWGADVIKIEHPESGDPQRGLAAMGLVPTGPGGVAHMMELPNRGKRSVGLDLRTEKGASCSCNCAPPPTCSSPTGGPRPAASRGSTWRTSVRSTPTSSTCGDRARVSGGPRPERGGYDGCTFWGRGGPADIISPPDDYPLNQPGPAFGDVIGGLTIAGGISAALFHRERTGEPVIVDNSLLATSMWATGATSLAAGLFGIERMVIPDRTQMPNPIVGMYRTSDNRYLSLVMLESDRYWGDLCQLAGRPELESDPRFIDAKARAENSAACVGILDEIFAQKTFAEWKEILAAAKGVWAPVQTPSEVLVDPMALANGYVREVEAKSRHGVPHGGLAPAVQRDAARSDEGARARRAHRRGPR